jgi:hypothetical protein
MTTALMMDRNLTKIYLMSSKMVQISRNAMNSMQKNGAGQQSPILMHRPRSARPSLKSGNALLDGGRGVDL